MERTIISWNLPNWITVTLMAVLGYLIIAIASQFIQGATGKGGGATGNGLAPSNVANNSAGY